MRAHVSRNQRWQPTGDSMLKATWNDLLARFPEPHVLVAVLPDSSEKESIFNAQSAQRLMVRLIRNLPTHGEFAVMVSRQADSVKSCALLEMAPMPPWLRRLPARPCQTVRDTPSCLMKRQSAIFSRLPARPSRIGLARQRMIAGNPRATRPGHISTWVTYVRAFQVLGDVFAKWPLPQLSLP